MTVRTATLIDAESIAALVNLAYEVEAFFVAGDRTNAADVRSLMTEGVFLVVDQDDLSGGVVACVFTSAAGGRGYFGMLAVSPEAQKRGLGRALIEASESAARDAGCRVMTIKVVNLRTDLLRRYERLGYGVTGTEPYVHRPVLQPCHFVAMEKTLTTGR
ncbi:MAG: GNAT family N-acetyltransferase [Acidobacteriota bacterium]